MNFEVFEPSGIVIIQGSIHYLFNNGLHNYNDFFRLDLFDLIADFCNQFSIKPESAFLEGFEFGVNVKVSFEPSHFIKRILAYKAGKIEALTDKTDSGNAIKIPFDQYRIKLYSKSNHFDLDNHLLRFEVKVKKMAKLKVYVCVQTLQDLMKPEILEKLGKMLLKEFNSLLVLEPLNISQLTARERASFRKMSTRRYWESLPNKSQRNYSKGRFKEITAKYGQDLHGQVYAVIAEKLDELIMIDQPERLAEIKTISQGVKVKERAKLIMFFSHYVNPRISTF